MFKAFDALPASIWLLICALLFCGWVATAYNLQGEQAAHARTQAAHSAQVAAAEQAARIQSETHRATEQELNHAQATHAQEAASIRLDLERAHAAGRAAAGRLQVAVAAAAARARAQCADPGAAELGAPAGDAIGVLAHVLGRADARAGELAELADRRGIAGRACEREYDAAHQALSALQATP